MASVVPQPKLTYRPQAKLEVFYTGGPFRISRDGKLLVCSCSDTIKIVELATGKILRTLEGDSEPISALAISPDCKTVVAASRSTTCNSWNIDTGALLRTWRPHKAPVAAMAIDASGGYVATASADRSVKVWDLQGGFCTHNFTGHSGVVMCVLFHPKQPLLFSGGDDHQVRAWDLRAKRCVAEYQGHFSAITSLAMSPDGWLLLSGGRDQMVHVWDIRSHDKVAAVPVFEAVEAVVAIPLGSSFPGVQPLTVSAALGGANKTVYFATAGEKGAVRIWRSDKAAAPVYQQPRGPELGPSDELLEMLLLPGGGGLLCGTADARLLMYQPQEVDGQRSLALTKQLIGINEDITDLRFIGAPATPTHIAVSTNSETVRLFDLATMSCTASLAGHGAQVLCMDAAHLGEGNDLLLSGAKDNDVRAWSAQTGRCLAIGSGHIGSVGAVALSRRSRKFAVSGGSDKLLKVWDTTPLLPAAVAATADEAAAPSSSAPPQPLQLKATAAVAAHDKDINAVAVAPNDSLVASASQDRTVKVWRLPALLPVLTLRGHKRGVWSVEFSPVDQVVLSASGDKTIKLWSLTDGSCLKTFEGHTGSVLRATFATAASQVLSCGADGLLKLWNVRSTECVNTFDEHEDKVWALTAGGSNESVVATGGGDAVVTIWVDTTAADAAGAAEEADALMQREQDLENALADGDLSGAARLAFDLKHPGRLLSAVQRAAADGGGSGGGPAALLQQLVAHMGPGDLRTALEYVREWNTNARNCHAAQAMLAAVLRAHRPDVILAISGAKELLDALLVYTQRHYNRVDKLVRSTFLLDFTLQSMQVLLPDDAAAADGGYGSSSEDDEAPVRPVEDKAARSADEMDEDDEDGEQAGPLANGFGNGLANGLANGLHSSGSSDEEPDEQPGSSESEEEAVEDAQQKRAAGRAAHSSVQNSKKRDARAAASNATPGRAGGGSGGAEPAGDTTAANLSSKRRKLEAAVAAAVAAADAAAAAGRVEPADALDADADGMPGWGEGFSDGDEAGAVDADGAGQDVKTAPLDLQQPLGSAPLGGGTGTPKSAKQKVNKRKQQQQQQQHAAADPASIASPSSAGGRTPSKHAGKHHSDAGTAKSPLDPEPSSSKAARPAGEQAPASSGKSARKQKFAAAEVQQHDDVGASPSPHLAKGQKQPPSTPAAASSKKARAIEGAGTAGTPRSAPVKHNSRGAPDGSAKRAATAVKLKRSKHH